MVESRENEATITAHILGPLEGLRLWLVAKLFKYGAALAGYDVRIIIDDGMGEVETTYWHAEARERQLKAVADVA